MGLWDWLGNVVAAKVAAQMAKTGTGKMIGGNAVYPDAKSATYVNDGYCGSAAVYTIVSTSAKKFANVPRSIYAPSTEKGFKRKSVSFVKKSLGQEIENSKLKDLLKRPNPYMGGDSFWEAVYTSYDLQGEAFIWLNRGDIEAEGNAREKIAPLEMYWLPAQYMELIPDQQDVWAVLGYTLNLNGSPITLYKEDIIHWKKHNPVFDANTREHLRGLSPLKAGLKLMTGDAAAQDAQVAMHQNDGAKGILFEKTLTSIDPTQRDTIKSVVDTKINNRNKKGAVAALQGDWGYLALGLSAVDLQLLEAMNISFARLCSLFRVSPNLFIAGQTRDNLREARKDHVTGKIMPDATSLDDELNRVFKHCFPGQIIASDFSELPEMQYEMDFINGIYKDMFQNGAVSIDEWRGAMGHDATGIPEHSQYFFTGNVIPISEAAMPQMNSDGLNGDNASSL
jgi:HK97 family phage portal protein